MELKTLITADYLDIVYDKRNKNYGGYELRKNYNRRVAKALGFLFLGVASMISFSFISSGDAAKPDKGYHGPTVVTGIHIDIEKPKVEIPKPKLPPTPPPPPTRTIAFTPPKVVDNNEIINNLPPDKNALTHVDVGLHNNDGDTTLSGMMPSDDGRKGGIPGIVKAVEAPVFKYVEQMPVFNGDMTVFMNSNLRYPDAAREANIDGQVIVNFVVNEDGAISNLKLMRGIGGGCDEEALRVISAMPKWKPGKQNGIPVKVFFTYPVRFILN